MTHQDAASNTQTTGTSTWYAWICRHTLTRLTTCNPRPLAAIEVRLRLIKDGRVISLIHKFLNAGVMEDGAFQATPEGVPQGGPLSPLLGNVMLNEPDKELTRRGHRFVRYADDCNDCKSSSSANR